MGSFIPSSISKLKNLVSKTPLRNMSHSHHHPHGHHDHQARNSLRMFKLHRPPMYATADKRPTFEGAYARAARRYKIGLGVFPGYCFKNDLVYRIRAVDDPDSGHEVPANSIQNGTSMAALF